MSQPVFEPDVEQEVRLPWAVICKLAVKARCLCVSLNEICEMALVERLKQAA